MLAKYCHGEKEIVHDVASTVVANKGNSHRN
jgi:hypothetical protein